MSYMIMLLLCAIMNGAVFYNLFSLLSYHCTAILIIEIILFLFVFNVIPVFMGVYMKKTNKSLLKGRVLPKLSFGIVVMTSIINIVLRIITIEQISLRTRTMSAIVSDRSIAVILTIVNCLFPIITAAGSYIITYIIYECKK
ncbi:MAG: hypothetical protein K6G26_02365 [Lachnospiraceae bacterium]|nr:hypothetical protein [Lachnospiraceae bacterium]